MVYGSSSTHSPAFSATCIYLVRGQKVADYHGKGNRTLSAKTATWCCLFEILTLPLALYSNDTCAWIRQFLFGDISCANKMQGSWWLQCRKARKGGQQRLTLASAVDLRLSGPRARDDYLTSPHWACHRHPYKTGLIYNWSVETGTKYTVVWSVFSGHTRIKEVFQTLLLGCRVYTLRSFISHHVGEPTNAGGQLTRVYQMRQLASNMVELPNVLVQLARRTLSSSSWSSTAPRWHGRSFFHLHP